jgi:hypothetical protein
MDDKSRFVFNLSKTMNPIPSRYSEVHGDQVWRMFACFRNGSYSIRRTMNIITVRPETNLEGLPHVGIVIDDQNVRLTHFATYLVPAKLGR